MLHMRILPGVGTTAERRRLVRSLLVRRAISSQQALIDALAERGHVITQATVSRDLRAVGAIKGPRGYELADDRHVGAVALGRALSDFCEAITPSGNLVVLKTPPGAAHLLAAAVDAAALTGVVGTVAGDDTVIVVTDEGTGGRTVATTLEQVGGAG
jgi:transcriptional regulator of arginine metabolism